MDNHVKTDFIKVVKDKTPTQMSKLFNKHIKTHQNKFRTLSKAQAKMHEKIFEQVYSRERERMSAQVQNEMQIR